MITGQRCCGWRSPKADLSVSGAFARLRIGCFDGASEPGVVILELKDHGNPGEVESPGEELADADQPVDVAAAVEPRAAGRADGLEQSPAFVQPQVLHPGTGQVRGHRNAVDAPIVVMRRRFSRINFCRHSCMLSPQSGI